ncbi:MAG: DUF5320 domain-containing protein [Candidatus Omnitrophota bacterium]
MPGFDGTGPIGQGPMAGGGKGYCAAALNDSGVNTGNIQGFYGKGGGRGFRNCFNTTGLPVWMRAQRDMRAFGGFGRSISKNDELAALKNQAGYLKNKIDAIQARVQDLEDKQ